MCNFRQPVCCTCWLSGGVCVFTVKPLEGETLRSFLQNPPVTQSSDQRRNTKIKQGYSIRNTGYVFSLFTLSVICQDVDCHVSPFRNSMLSSNSRYPKQKLFLIYSEFLQGRQQNIMYSCNFSHLVKSNPKFHLKTWHLSRVRNKCKYLLLYFEI